MAAGGYQTRIGGPSPTNFALTGAYFPFRFFGVELHGEGDVFRVSGTDIFNVDITDGSGNKRVTLGRALLSLSLLARAAPFSWLRLQLTLGYFGSWGSVLTFFPDQSGNYLRPHRFQGLAAKAEVGVHAGPVEVAVWARLGSSAFAGSSVLVTSDIPSVTNLLDLGLTVLHPLNLNPVRLSVGGEFVGFRTEGFSRDDAVTYKALATNARLSAVARIEPLPESVLSAPVVFEPAELRVAVLLEDGSAAAGAFVTVGSQPPRTTDATGHLKLSEPPAGETELTATLGNLTPATARITIASAGVTEATLTVRKPTGPGSIRGAVISAEKKTPIAGAEVSLESGLKVITDAAGAFVLSPAGPGPVKVSVKAAGFLPADDVVQVAPKAEATVGFSLATPAAPALATIRGSIRSATGKAVAATVKLSGLATPVRVSADGRFVTQVTSGTVTLTISAPGFVTQVKSVTVAPGDQALFHCDLQPVGR